MTNFVSLFPLKIVVFPNENLNIHIFEPKYVALINECINENKPLGILPVIKERNSEYGTLMEISEVVKKYRNGSLDIRMKGAQIFRLLERVNIPDKPFSGGIVSYPENIRIKVAQSTINLIIDEVMRLYILLGLEDKFPKDREEWYSYDIAHTIGLTLDQEYELLTIMNEIQRMEYIRRHLKSMQEVVKELEDLKLRIQANGQFRSLT